MANRITRWNPLREMAAMQNAIDRVFDDTWSVMNDGGLTTAGNWVALDVHENDNQYMVKADLPGLNPDDIHITVQENTLTISGEYAREEAPEGTQELLRERRFGRFSRSIKLPNALDVDNVDANYYDGVLHLTLAKSEAAKPRHIEVKSRSLISHN